MTLTLRIPPPRIFPGHDLSERNNMKKRTKRIPSVAVALLLILACQGTATAVERTFRNGVGGGEGATFGTHIDKANPTLNYDTAPSLLVGGTDDKMTLIHFPVFVGSAESALQVVPFGANVTAAWLEMTTKTDTSNKEVWAIKILREWSSVSANWDNAQTNDPWTQPGLRMGRDFYLNLNVAVPVTPTTPFMTYAWDVRDTVQAWVNGEPNYGFGIGGGGDDESAWCTENDATMANRPILRVEYDPPPDGTNVSFEADRFDGTCEMTYIVAGDDTPHGGEATALMEENINRTLIQWTAFIGEGGFGFQIPQGSTIYIARQALRFQAPSVDSFVMCPVLVLWTETMAHWTDRFGTFSWNAPGMQVNTDFTAIPSGPSFKPEIADTPYYQYVTDDVSSWAETPALNFGWTFRPVTSNFDQAAAHSDDAGGNIPSIDVFWGTPSGGTPPTAPTGIGFAPSNDHEMYELDPVFVAIYNDDGPVDVQATRYRCQVAQLSNFIDILFDSGVPHLARQLNPGEENDILNYEGILPPSETDYFFRMRYYTSLGDTGAWSAPVQFRVVESMQWIDGKRYHMLDLPIDTESRTVTELFGDNVSPLTIWEYDEFKREWVTPTIINPIMGYFIWNPSNNDNSLGANGSFRTEDQISVNLSYTDTGNLAADGWNLFRNPYGEDGESLDAFTHIGLTDCEPTIYMAHDGNQYGWYNKATDQTGGPGQRNLNPGMSIWIHATGLTASVTYYTPKGAGEPAPKPLPPPMAKWRVQLRASTAGKTDTSTYFAVREDASEQYDFADVLELRPFSADYIRVFFDNQDWGRYSAKYTQDSRPFPAEGETVSWTATVETTVADGSVTLDWDIPEHLSEWKMRLKDVETGVIVDMSAAPGYSYTATGSDTREFTITVTRHGRYVVGDGDGNGVVDPADALLAARAEHGLVSLSASQKILLDVDGSGKVNVLDSLIICKMAKGHLE
ncbi:MAG: DNRLRE domain-containing protein [Planctomycetota bacterium]|nr:MAG: DNRLRE domain-containing protein [Planctomycetota bacterium]